mmetsp:Transcript_108709/g.171493  ORF Transcript_108709/g.171493 Transcript_108709/m.171493 type:complete len:95 (-) Transcript_108709:87-371(-)|eukprot:CAMPEP_0169077870 /NCGR_PEP_ID=MMETSP1015-20121227/9107_1 /TAXON_ID=342587 /ORGANISM="Karlodinium micrum, Strain CCMP2283" /LENGTH=94 /DNA_ID=CAMNT_0009137419 /DNA_START=76 /DNA_END=360 /DNA_ORIENTATION=-
MSPLAIVGIVIAFLLLACLASLAMTLLWKRGSCTTGRSGDTGERTSLIGPDSRRHPHLVSWESDGGEAPKDRSSSESGREKAGATKARELPESD